MMKSMETIRHAKYNDIDQIYLIEIDAFDKDAYSKESMLTQIKNDDFYVMERENKIIGYITILKRKNSRSVRLYNFTIHKDYRGKGYSHILITYILTLYIAYNIYLEVRKDNIQAIKLYEKYGFEKTKEIPNYYYDGTSAYKMIRKI